MTPKEKAIELVDNYDETLTYLESKNKAKQCALIAVDEINKVYESLDEDADIMFKKELNYWQEVKKEIELL